MQKFISFLFLIFFFVFFFQIKPILACDNPILIETVFRDFQNQYITEMNFEIDQQIKDADGNPQAGDKVVEGKTNKVTGIGRAEICDLPYDGYYVLKVWNEKNKNIPFKFFDIEINAFDDKISLEKHLSNLHIVLRKADGSLLKNKSFSVYTQKFDVDNNPINEKKDFISTLTTSDKGEAVIYLPSSIFYQKGRGGIYAITVQGENGKDYVKYGIVSSPYANTYAEYVLSDVILQIKDALGNVIKDKTINFYYQKENLKGEPSLGDFIKSFTTDTSGRVRFEYPDGVYAAVFKDSANQDFIVWNVFINDNERTTKEVVQNITRVQILDKLKKLMPAGTGFTLWSLKQNEAGYFFKDKSLGNFSIGEPKYADLNLKQGPYLVSISSDGKEYGSAIYSLDGKKQDLLIKIHKAYLIHEGEKFWLSVPSKPKTETLTERLNGRILLQVEEHGEAWYVYKGKRYYMKDGPTAYNMMRNFGLGISNDDLRKIPIGVNNRFSGKDSDNDGLMDKLEEGIGTDIFNQDSDGDGYSDKEEVINGYNPLGMGKVFIDQSLVNRLKGRILLQVENKGQAWYLNPEDGKRYYMKDGEAAFQIMRFLSLGITNNNLAKIRVGKMD